MEINVATGFPGGSGFDVVLKCFMLIGRLLAKTQSAKKPPWTLRNRGAKWMVSSATKLFFLRVQTPPRLEGAGLFQFL